MRSRIRRLLPAAVILAGLASVTFSAQTGSTVDFARDVQPIFRQQCVGCHGPAIHQNGFRLDRRSDAMRGGTIAMIGPGNSDGSRLYQRLVGSAFGAQMPPTGALQPAQIATIKAWIDQGADWPDALANEAPPVPMRALDAQLMKAALWSDVPLVRQLLDQGADPNARNEAGATALMWAADDRETSRLLLEYGANVEAQSDDGRTPLIIAAGRFGASPIVELMLEYGANPSAKAPGLADTTTPLIEAAYHGDASTMRLLVRHGADVKASAQLGAILSIYSHCDACFDTFAAVLDKTALGAVAISMAPPDDDAAKIGVLLKRGADVHAKDAVGRTLLMRAAASDKIPLNIARTLVASGVDVNATTPAGETALGNAERRGHTPMVDFLPAAGARSPGLMATTPPMPSPAPTIPAAVARSLPLLQQNAVTFQRRAGCVSCHNNSITALAVSTARAQGLPVDEAIAREQVQTVAAFMNSWRERTLQDLTVAGDHDTVSYVLVGLAAEGYRPDDMTDAMARFLRRQQTPAGHWRVFAHRPPIESSDIEVTALSMRALQTYAPSAQRAEYDKTIRLARTWLTTARAANTEDRAFQLLGLGWAKADRHAIERAGRALVAEQRPDGGWAPLPSLGSDAYATGQALVALAESGALQPADPAYAKGVQFLLKTQLADGSWLVRTRAVPFQPHFESGFPHQRDQFISAAATGWATMALSRAYGKPS